MTYLLLALSLVNLVPTMFTGNLATLGMGSALLLLACVWACGEAGEVEYEADEA